MDVFSTDLQRLLEDDRWMRRLARRLVADPASAEDLAQETWVAAWQTGERPEARSWLARVLRNVWKDRMRERERRERRERSVARPEAQPAADELVAELEVRERLARALRELEEPLRGTLVRRFLRDESLTEIAADEDVAVSTVHERVERGLGLLRRRLDNEHGGRAWVLVLLPLARRSTIGTGTTGLNPLGVTIMGGALKVALAVALAGAAGWWWLGRETARAPGSAGVSAHSEGERGAPDVSPPLLVPTTREPDVASTPSRVAPESTTRSPIQGRVLLPDGKGLGGVEVVLEGATGPGPCTAFDGAFELEPDSAVDLDKVRLNCPEDDLVMICNTRQGEEFLLIVAPARTLAGRVLDVGGAPIGGATLTYRPQASLFRELGLELLPARVQPGWSATSGTDGAFTLLPVALGPHFGLEVRAQGFVERAVLLGESEALDIVLERDRLTSVLVGYVLGPDGDPFAGAEVSAGDEIVRSDAGGRFELAAHAKTGRSVQDEGGVWREEIVERVKVFALAPGCAPAVEEVVLAAPPAEFVLHLGPTPLSIVGRVIGSSGEPRPGVVLWPRTPTPFGRVPRGAEGVAETPTVEERLCDTWALGTVTDEVGNFRLECLLDQAYDLEVLDSHTMSRRSLERVRPGRDDLEIVLDPEPSTTRVAGRVVSVSGEPQAGVEIRPRRVQSVNHQPPQLVGGVYGLKTDADGRFEFEALAVEGTVLDLFWMPWQTIELATVPDLERIEIVQPLTCELQVILSDHTLATSFAVLDARGTELELTEFIHRDGQSWSFTMDERVEFHDGRSNVVRAPETARRLVLYQGEREVLRLPLALDPKQPTVVRP